MFERCFLQHLILLSVVIWSVQCNENQCVCKMCPQFSTPGAHCECCVWHFYGKRGLSDAGGASMKRSFLPSAITTAAEAAATVDSDEDNTYFEDTPCRSDVYSNPDPRIRIGASLNTIKQRLRCLLWLKKDQQKKINLFYS